MRDIKELNSLVSSITAGMERTEKAGVAKDSYGHITISDILIQWGVKSVAFTNDAYIDQAIVFGMDYDSTSGLVAFGIFEGVSGTSTFAVGIVEDTLAVSGVTFHIEDINSNVQTDTLDLFWVAIGKIKSE